jgi:hypothetical protein
MPNDEESLCVLIKNLRKLEMDLLSPDWLLRNSESSRLRELLGQVKVAVDNVRNSIWCVQALPESDHNDMVNFIEQHRMHRAIELLRSRGRNSTAFTSPVTMVESQTSCTHNKPANCGGLFP